jgi:acyclic terpene utilization AtuA family protein
MKTVRIGSGAGFAGDRIEPAVELAARGSLDYLVFECLAERTIALAQEARAKDSSRGFDSMLERRLEAVLPACREHGVTIVTNMGAANPASAGARAREVALRLGCHGLAIATVSGDDVYDLVMAGDFTIAETGAPVSTLKNRLISANAYIGAEPIVRALAEGAGLVITGRAADPSLFVAPLAHSLGWQLDAWPALGRGTLVGHLLECAGQVTGGYFADPGRKDVAGLEHLGFPIAEVAAEGPIVITKVSGSGGAVTAATCKEQLLYEIHDPSAYITPDTVADFSQVTVTELAYDRVAVDGATGRARPETLKVSLGYRDGFIGEGQISYAGSGALRRARLATAVVRDRLERSGIAPGDVRCDLIGVSALHGEAMAPAVTEPYEVRVRVAARAPSREAAGRIGEEVESLYTNGPAGGGGATRSVREVVAIASTFIPRALVRCAVQLEIA